MLTDIHGNIMKNWEYNEKLEDMDLLIVPLRLSVMKEEKKVNLVFITLEKGMEELERDVRENKHEFEIVSHYCAITSLSRLLTSTVRKDNRGKAYICRSCCNCF